MIRGIDYVGCKALQKFRKIILEDLDKLVRFEVLDSIGIIRMGLRLGIMTEIENEINLMNDMEVIV